MGVGLRGTVNCRDPTACDASAWSSPKRKTARLDFATTAATCMRQRWLRQTSNCLPHKSPPAADSLIGRLSRADQKVSDIRSLTRNPNASACQLSATCNKPTLTPTHLFVSVKVGRSAAPSLRLQVAGQAMPEDPEGDPAQHPVFTSSFREQWPALARMQSQRQLGDGENARPGCTR